MIAHLRALVAPLKTRLTRAILAHRIRVDNPSLDSDPTAIWDYGYHDLDAIELGKGVVVRAYSEILVYKRSRHTSVEGRLIMEDGAIVSMGANIRAAGGTIRIGRGSGVGQNCVLVAANHQIRRGEPFFRSPWDETRIGVDIGDNVWIAANCVVLPGVRIGDGSLIAAGAVVTGNVPPNEIWGGVPARKIRDVPYPLADVPRALTEVPRGLADAPPALADVPPALADGPRAPAPLDATSA